MLVWSSYQPHYFGGHGKTVTGMLDLTDDSAMPATIALTNHDMFCPGVRSAALLKP